MRILINIFIKSILGFISSFMGLSCQTPCKCVSVWLSQVDVSKKRKENLDSYNSCYISVWYMTTGVSCWWTYPHQEEQNSSLCTVLQAHLVVLKMCTSKSSLCSDNYSLQENDPLWFSANSGAHHISKRDCFQEGSSTSQFYIIARSSYH